MGAQKDHHFGLKNTEGTEDRTSGTVPLVLF